MNQILSIAILLLAVSASAGEVLHLKNGEINTTRGVWANKGFAPQQGVEYYIIQFRSKVTEAVKQKFASQGISFYRYVPEDAFVAKVDSAQSWEALNKSEDIRAVVPYVAKFKLSEAVKSNASKGGTAHVVARLVGEDSMSAVLNKLQTLGNYKKAKVSNTTLAIELPASDLEKLGSVEGIEWVEMYPKLQTFEFAAMDNDDEDENRPIPNGTYEDLTGYESGTKILNFETAWSKGFHGEGEVVAVSDTGLDVGSIPSLMADFTGQVLKGYPMGFLSFDWSDPHGHGTHVSGSIVGSGKISGGKLKGGAYQAKLIMAGLWSPLFNNISVNPDLDKLFGNPHRDGANVYSNSWGNGDPRQNGIYDAFAAGVDEVSYNYPDLLLVFAAGNGGEDRNRDGRIDEGSVSSPGTAKNVLTVGASENLTAMGRQIKHGDWKSKDAQGNVVEVGKMKWGVEPISSDTMSNNPSGMAMFSSRGPTKDGRIKPEVVAPGTNILSTVSQHPEVIPQNFWSMYNKNYAWAGGTSMATPLTSGSAAVTRQVIRSFGINPSAALVKAALLHTAFDMFPGQYGTGATQEMPKARPNNQEGYGRVDMAKVTTLRKEMLVDERAGVATGEEKAISVSLKKGQKLRATMVYTDAPGTASAAVALVNDLDLIVKGPNQRTQYPNQRGGPDRINNTEMVETVAAADGAYSVVVKGDNVPSGKNGAQGYALVYSVE